MNIDICQSVIAACVAMVAALAVLAIFITRKEPRHLLERAKNGEILLLSFSQIVALYDSAPAKWDLQVSDPVYYPNGKDHDGLLVFMLPHERRKYQSWFNWRLFHSEKEQQQFQITVQALQAMQEDLAAHQKRLQKQNQKALQESAQAVQRILSEQKEGRD